MSMRGAKFGFACARGLGLACHLQNTKRHLSMTQRLFAGLVAGLVMFGLSISAAGAKGDDTYGPDEITQAVSDFFGVTTEAAAKAVEHVFKDQGRPDGYIKGEE